MNLVDAVLVLMFDGDGSKGYYSEAVQAIGDGQVKINQEPCLDPIRKLKGGEIVEWQSISYGSLQYIVPDTNEGKKNMHGITLIIPVKPVIKVPNDDKDQTMWDNGYILGFSKKLKNLTESNIRVLWAFGFVPESMNAKAYHVSLDDFNQVLVFSNKDGDIVKKDETDKSILKLLVVPKKPRISVKGDNKEKAMWHNGFIIGFTNKVVIWSFGFEEGSPQAEAYGIFSPDAPRIVTARHNGHTI